MKFINKLLDKIKYDFLELGAFGTLIIWAINPFVEKILKTYYRDYYTHYFTFSIYAVGILGFIIFGLYLIKKIKDKKITLKKSIPYVLILILWIISIFATIFSKNPDLSFFGDSYRKEGLIIYTLYIGFAFLASIITKKEYINNLFIIIIASALFISIMPLFNEFFTYINYINIYHNTNHYGYYLLIATGIAAFSFLKEKSWKKYFYLISYIIIFYMLIMNDTFGCYLALFISMCVAIIYCAAKKFNLKKAMALLVIFVAVSFVTSYFNLNIGATIAYDRHIVNENLGAFRNDLQMLFNKDRNIRLRAGSYRLLLWDSAFKYTLKHPILGGGFETLRVNYPKEGIYFTDRPHNIMLQVSSSIGIPGALIYFGLICFLALANIKNINKEDSNVVVYFTAMGYFISSQFGNTMYYTSPYFAILIGLLIGMYIRNIEIK